MPRQEDIRNTIWDDLDELNLSNEAVLLYIWSWTNRRCDNAGFYSCPKRLLLEGRLGADVDGPLQELIDAGKVRYEDGVLWSVTRVKRLPWKTPNAANGIRKELAELGADNPIHAAFIEMYDGHPWGKNGGGRLTLTDGMGNPSPSHANGMAKGSPSDGPDRSAKPNGQPSPIPSRRDTGKGVGRGIGKGREGSSTSIRGLETASPEIQEAFPTVAQALARITEIRGVPFADEARIVAAMCAYPDADHVGRASDMEDWLCNGTGKKVDATDLVQLYRGQLERKPGRGRSDSKPAEDFSQYDKQVVPSG